MNKSMAILAAIAVLAGSASALNNTSLYFNDTAHDGNAYSSQNDTNSFGNFATVYASFNAVGTIDTVAWLGEYFNPPQQGQITGFTLSFYADNAGAVGGLVNSQHFNGTNNESFFETANGFPVYEYYDFITPVGWNGDGWLAVVPDLGFPPQWGMVGGVNNRFAQQDFFGSRSTLGQSVALYLGGDTAVPEPASMAALGLGVVALIRKRKAAK
ncbi:MAG: PEP-CTERM sorting domain-containing protein [Armatimonadetes bacterium]|nr:PEP-CTERM sorting domain-containing protein [Armatimonadota bacterium]